MRARSALRRRRSPRVYLLLGLGAVSLTLSALALWGYEHDPRVRFHVQVTWGDLRALVVKQPYIVPTPARAFSMPTLAPMATPLSTVPATATRRPSPSPGPTASATPPPTATPEPPTPTALPPALSLSGFRHEFQLSNNCGPTTLGINLSYWGWDGDQKDVAQVVRPSQDDKNVSPHELYEYGLTQGYDAYIRVNGNLETLQRFIAAGYPVLVEKGFPCGPGDGCTGWVGHYVLVTGYDGGEGTFVLQDSFRGPDIKVTHDSLLADWRAFNYLYLIVFPIGEADDARIRELLGPAALDLDQNYRDALARAQQETLTSEGEAAALAWFNVGTNLHNLQDYAGAAAAYDQARQIGLPFRMLWYQFGPYRSYYSMARYQEVVDLATFAIGSVHTVPGLEEAYYWRGLAEVALGQPDQAAADFRTALQRHPGWAPAIDGLAQLGLTP